jgi:hypothetical protein
LRVERDIAQAKRFYRLGRIALQGHPFRRTCCSV